MKSKDSQNVVLSKYQNGDSPTEIYHDLSGTIGLRTIKRWCQMIHQTGTISLSSPPRCPHWVRTKKNIKKVKDRSRRKSRVSARKIAIELDIGRISVRRMLKSDIELRPNKKTMELPLSNDQRVKRKNLQIRFGKISEKRTQQKSSFQPRSILTSMVSIILRTIECGQQIVLTLTLMKRVALSRDESTHKK